MSANGKWDVDIEMSALQDPIKQPTMETAAGPSNKFTVRFASILMAYDDEKTWWDAVNDFLVKEGDFAASVATKEQAEGVESRQQAIIKVMVDLLLDMEGISVSQGLVYVLDELESYPLEFLATELLKRGTNLEIRDNYGYTPLLKAVKYGAPGSVVDLLLEHGADVHAVAEDRKTVLHLAAQKHDEAMLGKLIERGLSESVNAEDKDGWTPLHDAAYYGREVSAAVLIEKGAFVNARNHRKRTPLHVAAEEGEEDFITFLLSNKADANIPDPDGYTPLDLAAKNKHEGVVKILLQHPPSSAKDNAVQLGLEDVMTTTDHHDIKDGTVKEKISEMSPFGVVSMFKPSECGDEARFKLIKQFARNSRLKKTTKAIMDHFVLGKRRGYVNCEVLDADENGVSPDSDNFDENSPSLLDFIVETNDKELAQHPSIRAMLDHKWDTFAKYLFFRSAVVYAVRMLFFGLALLIAARPDLDNPGCYRDGWDYFRGICEGISVGFFIFNLVNEILEMLSLRWLYLKDQYNYVQLPAAVLPLLIIPFRAATTWCASTGNGYCVDPTLLQNTSNATNFILDIDQACITASSVQWIIASLAYMANAMLVLEFLTLSRKLGVYVEIIKGMVVKDMLKFSVLFIIGLYIFVGSFYLALRAGVQDADMSTGAVTSDLERFRLQTLYPWHVVFTGIRILIESRGILNYVGDNNDGYHWFSVVMYMAFLIAVLVVLLNVLIAQMSNTYNEIQKNVDGAFAIARARIISRLQKERWPLCKGKTFRKNYFKKYIWTELTAEELAQEEKQESAEERVILMEQKTDWLKGSTGEIIRRLQDREDTALDYKRLMEHKVDQMTAKLTSKHLEREESAQQIKRMMDQKVDQMAADLTRRHLEREDSAQQIKRMTDQKVDQIAAELTRRQQEREDTALEYKSLLEQKVDQVGAELTKRQQEREDSAQQIKSLIEQKVDQMASDLIRRQQEREDAALQHKRVMEEKVDHLTEMTVELATRFQEMSARWPFMKSEQK